MMKLGMQVGLGPGHTMLDGDPAPPPAKVGRAPNFWPYLLWPNGWMNQDATWYGQTAGCVKMPLGMELGLSPGEFVLNRDPDPSPKRGQNPLPNFKG